MSDKFFKFLRHYGLSMCTAITILYVCMMPSSQMSNDISKLFTNIDKVVHFLMYFFLSGCIVVQTYRESENLRGLTVIMWAVIIPILYGGLIEVLQEQFTLTRSGDVMDLLSDAAGTLTAYLVGIKFVPSHFNKNEN